MKFKGFGTSHINMEKTSMSGTVTRLCAPIALAMFVGLSACTEKKSQDSLAQDTALNRDLQMANADTSAQPALKDVPAGAVAPAPVAPTTATPRATPRTTAPARSTRPVVRTPARPA